MVTCPTLLLGGQLCSCSTKGAGADARPGSDLAPPGSYGRTELLDFFDKQAVFFGTALRATLDAAKVAEVTAAAGVELERLQPAIPYIGALQWPLPSTLVGSAVSLAFYRVLQPRGFSLQAVGDVIANATRADLSTRTPDALHEEGARQFTQQSYDQWKGFAAQSQQRRFAGDWVYEFVPGVAGSFDWGVDYLECGIAKLFKSQGALELAPALCALDFVVSEAQGTGLTRTKTLVQGGDRCDFRYRKPS